ncbi:hypothetical protein BKA70DRAFT_1293301 [Coprinopsis sp. MPI-PUGE-AT-0042]|nr:hypothetical protein BKA70DRAFT_1293301 [Coprinopsis sp. MPI-PUGE-AT-0042]
MSPSRTPLPALMSQTDMVAHEMDVPVVEAILNGTFESEERWTEKGLESPLKQWYKRVATVPTAVRTRIADGRVPDGRLMAWNPKNLWHPKNIFFRSNDTCRLLPMNCGIFRVQLYAMPCLWNYLEQIAEARRRDGDDVSLNVAKEMVLASLIHEIALLRNFHDFGASDIPVLITNWTPEQMDAACEYWVKYSEDKWAMAETKSNYDAIDQAYFAKQKPNPCFHQADCLFRALLIDHAAEDGKARAIFTRPQFTPPQSLVHDYPTSCHSVSCTSENCSFFDFSKSVSLAEGSSMVRKSVFGEHTVRCNYWPCQNSEPRVAAGDDAPRSTMLKCGKCKDVVYCCAGCQARDWRKHKVACQVPALN